MTNREKVTAWLQSIGAELDDTKMVIDACANGYTDSDGVLNPGKEVAAYFVGRYLGECNDTKQNTD